MNEDWQNHIKEVYGKKVIDKKARIVKPKEYVQKMCVEHKCCKKSKRRIFRKIRVFWRKWFIIVPKGS